MNARLFVACVVIGAALAPVYAHAYVSPGAPAGYINDFAHVLSVETKNSLESELAAFEASTTNQIAVAIVPDMDGDYVEHYAVELFKEWGIGQHDQDNGALVVVAVQEHKLRIEVGYGLEGALPDSVAQRILDNEMTPRLRANDYDGAIVAAVRAIESATRGEYTATNTSTINNEWLAWFFNEGWTVLIVMLFGVQWLGSMLGRSRSWWAGGVLGFTGAALIGSYFALAASTIGVMLALSTLLGLLFDYVVSSAFRKASRSGSSPPWWAGGNTIGGSHSSGGGFGGVGGGSSGGGGASGSW